MIELQTVSFSYGKTPVLSEISLALEPGKLYAVLGPNGCGKTTLMKLLARLEQPKSGTIFLDGKSDYSRNEFAKRLALMPQGRNIPDTTVFELVCCGRYPHTDFSRRLREADFQIVEIALKATDSDTLAHKRLKKLSGGERQRAYLAMLLAQDTPYVLLDEPTTHLDIACAFQTMELLKQMRDSGKCVVAVLHDLDLALKYADEILLMHRGKLLSKASPEQTVESGMLDRVFGVRCIPIIRDGQREYLFNPSSMSLSDPVMDFPRGPW